MIAKDNHANLKGIPPIKDLLSWIFSYRSEKCLVQSKLLKSSYMTIIPENPTV